MDALPNATNKTGGPRHVGRVFAAKLLEHHPFLRTNTKRVETVNAIRFDGPATQFGMTSAWAIP